MSDTPRTDRLKKEMSWEEFCDNAFPLLQSMERELAEKDKQLKECSILLKRLSKGYRCYASIEFDTTEEAECFDNIKELLQKIKDER